MRLPSSSDLRHEFHELQDMDDMFWRELQFSSSVHQRYSNILLVEWSRLVCQEELKPHYDKYREDALNHFQEFLKQKGNAQVFRALDVQALEDNTIVHANLVRATDVNAFMPGYHTDTNYIASQAPIEPEIPNFVHALVHHRVPLVAVVSKTSEKRSIKVHKWWPTQVGKVLNHSAHVRLELLDAKEHDDFVERRIRATVHDMTHEFTMIHYEAWPDYGIPKLHNFISMTKFIREKLEKQERRDLWVHCSAGIGRTSTLISSLILHEQAHNHLKDGKNKSFTIHLPRLISLLKFHRAGMTQTTEQYGFTLQYIVQQLKTDYPKVQVKYESLFK